MMCFLFSSRRRHTRWPRDWSSDVCSSDLNRVVTQEELLEFVRDRVNIVLERLEMPKMFDQEPGLISGWFYNQLNTVKVPDFFAGTQIQYRRNWDRFKLTFRPEVENVI